MDFAKMAEGFTKTAKEKGMFVGWWTPVSERLPKPKETEDLIAKYYLVQNEYGDMMVARWDGKGWEQMYQHEYLEDDVIAWMPLPKPYKSESEE